MKLYFYECFGCFDNIIKKSIREVEEKPNTFRDNKTNSVFKKSDVGTVVSCGTRVFLYDDDFEKAKAIFIEYQKNLIKQRERDIEHIHEEISRIKCNIEKLSKQEETECE